MENIDELISNIREQVQVHLEGYIGDPITEDQLKGMGNNVAQIFATMFQDDRINCVEVKEDPLNEGVMLTTISIPRPLSQFQDRSNPTEGNKNERNNKERV